MSASTTTTYRRAAPIPGEKRPLSKVHLAGAPRHVQRAFASVRIGAALVAVGAFFAPWHVVHPLQGGFQDALCWGPGCHDYASYATSQPSFGPAYTHTGWSHSNTVLPLVILALIVGASCVPFRRPRMSLALAALGGIFMSLVGLSYALFDLQHLFDHVQFLVGERAFDRSVDVVTITMFVELVATPFLYLWARARLIAA